MSFYRQNFSVKERITIFREFGDFHTTKNNLKLLKMVFKEYNLTKKIFAINFEKCFEQHCRHTTIKTIV